MSEIVELLAMAGFVMMACAMIWTISDAVRAIVHATLDRHDLD